MGAKGEEPTNKINSPTTRNTSIMGINHHNFLLHKNIKNSLTISNLFNKSFIKQP